MCQVDRGLVVLASFLSTQAGVIREEESSFEKILPECREFS